MLYYDLKRFKIIEFFPPNIAKLRNVELEWFMNPAILWTADSIRERYKKPLFVNTWMFPGMPVFSYRGFRQSRCSVGAEMSQHKLGNAIDFNVDGISAAEVQADIQKHPFDAAFQYITCLEKEPGVEKTHIDVRPRYKEKSGILILSKT